MKEVNLSWSDWYNKQIKKGSKSLQEELDKCKSMLEAFWLIQKSDFKPWYMEELLEDLKEENITESQIEEALDDLICWTNFIFPLREAIEGYIKWKDRANFEKVETAFSAVSAFATFDISKINHEKLDEIAEPFILRNMGLETLWTYLIYSIRMLEGTTSLVLLGNPTGGILLRSAIEIFLKGVIFEHIKIPYFRQDINRMLRSGKRADTVTLFVKEVENYAGIRKIPVRKVIEDSRLRSLVLDRISSSRLSKGLKISDILYWLNRWKVFDPIPNSTNIIKELYRNLSDEAHGNLPKAIRSIALREFFLDKFLLLSVTNVIDIMVVTILNTIKNTVPESYNALNQIDKENLFSALKEANLKYSMEKLLDFM